MIPTHGEVNLSAKKPSGMWHDFLVFWNIRKPYVPTYEEELDQMVKLARAQFEKAEIALLHAENAMHTAQWNLQQTNAQYSTLLQKAMRGKDKV